MALEEIASTGDTLALAKTNAAIRAAKELQSGLADATSLLAETTALHIESSSRPGEARLLFTSSLTGAGKEQEAINFGQAVTNAEGIALRVTSTGGDPIVVASRVDQAVEPGIVYSARVAVRRQQNTSDPYGDAVQFGISCLNANKQKVSERVFAERALIVADGVLSMQVTFSRDQAADLTVSETTRYVRAFVRIFGGNGVTDVEVVGTWEGNGLPGPKGDTGAEPEYFLDVEAEEIRWRQADGTIGPVLDIGSARKKSEAAADRSDIASASAVADAATAAAEKAQAVLAAQASGAPLYTVQPSSLAGVPSPYRLLVSAGEQIYTHNGTTSTMVGWLGNVAFDTVPQIAAFMGPLGPVGYVVSAAGFRYRVASALATDMQMTTAAGVKLYALPGSDGAYNLASLGAVANNPSIDILPMWNAMMRIPGAGYGTTIVLPQGDFYSSQTLVVDRPVGVFGQGSGIADLPPFSYSGTRIYVPGGQDGLTIVAGGAYATIEDIAFVAQAKTTWACGVRFKRRANLNRVFVSGFYGHGYELDSRDGSNINYSNLIDCYAKDCTGDGYYAVGADSNAGRTVGFNATGCGGEGIRDNSFLGNHHSYSHVANNAGAYFQNNANSSGSFIGCYSENKQWNVNFNNVLAGSNNSHNVAGTPYASDIYAFIDTTGLHRITVSAGGSGYTSAPTVVIPAPVPGSQATATAILDTAGRVVAIQVTGMGTGYGVKPAVTITDATGTGATASAWIGKPLYPNGHGQVWTVSVDTPGTGYTNPTVTIAPPTQAQAAAVAVLGTSGSVDYVVITNPGSGYTSPPVISFTGGGGAGAAATANLSVARTNRVELAQSTTSLLQWRSSAVATGAGAELVRLQYADGNSGDMSLDWSNNPGFRWMYLTGSRTRQTYGRTTPQPFKPAFPSGIVLGGNRLITMVGTVPPTSGEYARGEVVLSTSPSAGGSPGAVCTTGGIAGSTAVFKAMAALAA